MRPKSGPGMVLGDLGAPFGVLRAIFKKKICAGWREDGRKMGEVGAKLATSCDQDGP